MVLILQQHLQYRLQNTLLEETTLDWQPIATLPQELQVASLRLPLSSSITYFTGKKTFRNPDETTSRPLETQLHFSATLIQGAPARCARNKNEAHNICSASSCIKNNPLSKPLFQTKIRKQFHSSHFPPRQNTKKSFKELQKSKFKKMYTRLTKVYMYFKMKAFQ